MGKVSAFKEKGLFKTYEKWPEVLAPQEVHISELAFGETGESHFLPALTNARS